MRHLDGGRSDGSSVLAEEAEIRDECAREGKEYA